jgi:hypothetical protein
MNSETTCLNQTRFPSCFRDDLFVNGDHFWLHLILGKDVGMLRWDLFMSVAERSKLEIKIEHIGLTRA